MEKTILRRNIFFRLFIYTFQFIITLTIDYFSDYNLFNELNIYYFALGITIGVVFLCSLTVRKIILTESYLIFDYHIWFSWRKQMIMIEDIKSIRAEQKSKTIIVYVERRNPEKETKFETIGFKNEEIRHLISDIYRHPKNRIELSLS